jgi:hypothetical protein
MSKDYSHLPAQIRRQAEEADRLLDELNSGQDNAQAEEQADVTEGSEPADADGQTADTHDTAADESGDSTPEAETDPAANEDSNGNEQISEGEETAQKDDSAADWKQKYQTLDGKYKAEVPRLTRIIKELRYENTQLSRQVSRLSSGEDGTHRVGHTDAEINPDSFAEYGEDVKNLARMTAEERKRNQELHEKMQKIESSLQVKEETAFEDRLEQLCPNAFVQNHDSEFVAYLQANPEINGKLQTAVTGRNADAVAEVFNTYRRQAGYYYGTETPAAVNPPAASPKEAEKNPLKKTDVSRQVQPTKNRPASSHPSTKIYTRADIKKFYDDVARGRYTEKESAALEADINKAINEGRVSS